MSYKFTGNTKTHKGRLIAEVELSDLPLTGTPPKEWLVLQFNKDQRYTVHVSEDRSFRTDQEAVERLDETVR
jgi:hypothetical protein